MTDSEIIKALERCSTTMAGECKQCPLYKQVDNCTSKLTKDALDLINRQKAEIDNLNVYCENLEISQSHLLNECATVRKETKSEAIKEFAEKLKKEIFCMIHINGNVSSDLVVRVLDNLVKEMTEENNG